MAGKFQAELKVDVSQAITGVKEVDKKISDVVENVKTLRGLKATAKVDVDVSGAEVKAKNFGERMAALRALKATANVDVDVNDSDIAELKKDIAAVDGKNVDVNVNVKQPSGGLTAFTAGIGAAVGGAALTGVTALAEGLLEGAQAADAFGDTLSIAFTQQGIADVEGEIESVKQSTLSLAQELGLPIARVRELGQAVATIGGLSGEQAEGLTKLSVSIETFTDGTVKGEAIVKAFSRGIADPEGAAAIDALSKKYPQLSDTLRSTASASEKLAEANKILGPSFAAAVAGANDVGGVIQRVKNTVSEGFENVGTKIADAILPIITFILDAFTRLQPVLAPLIASIAEKFESVGKIIAPILAFIGGAIITNIVTTIQFAGAVLTTALGLFEKAFNAVALSIQPLIDAVKKLFGADGELGKGVNVLDLFQQALSFVGEAFGAISDIVVELGGLLFDFVLTPFQAVIAIIAGVITKVQEWFGASKEANEEQKKGASILEILRTAFANIQGTIAGVTSAFRTIKEVIGEFFAALGSFNIKRALESFTGFGDKVKESYDKGFNSVAKLKAEQEAATKASEDARRKQEAADRKVVLKPKNDNKADKSALEIQQKKLQIAIADRAQQLLNLQAKNADLVRLDKLTAKEAKLAEAVLRTKLAEENRLQAIDLLKAKLDDEGIVIGTSIKLAEGQSLQTIKDTLQNLSNALRTDEQNVLQLRTDISREELGKQVADALAFANELAGAKFFDFDESTLKRFIDKGIDGVDGFSDFVAKRVAELDAQIKILGELAAQQNETERAKSLTDVTKLEAAKLAILQKAALAEIEVRKGVAEKLEEENVLGTALVKTLASFEIVVDNDAANKALEETKELIAGVNEEFASGELTYQQAMEKLKDVSKEQSDFMEAVASAVAESGETLSKSLATSAKEGRDAGESVGDTTALVAASVGASFISMAASGENVWVALAKAAFDGLQAMVPIWSALIIGGSLATPQSILTAGGAGLAQWAALTAIIQLAVTAARAGLGFKDGGPTGDNIGSNQVAGVVHGKEFVAPERMYAKHGDLLKHLYANRELSSFPEIQSLMKQNQIIPMRDLALNMGGGSQSITVNAMAGDALKPLQDELQGVRRQLVAMEALHKSSSDITVTADEGYHARRARRSAIKGARN